MHTAEINYYQVLGISETATTSDIKKSYRLLSKQFHPDTVGGDEKKMAQINAAYAVLSDPIKRHYYEPPKPKAHKQPQTQPTTTKPTYNQPPFTSYSKPRYETTAARKNYTAKKTYKDDDNWNRAFTYGFTLFFIIVLAAFALPAANKFLVAYEANAASDSANQNLDTSPNTSPSYSSNPPSQNTSLDNNSYSDSTETYNVPTVTDTVEPAETDGTSVSTPIATPTPSPTPTSSQSVTNSQETKNKWFNRRYYRNNN